MTFQNSIKGFIREINFGQAHTYYLWQENKLDIQLFLIVKLKVNLHTRMLTLIISYMFFHIVYMTLTERKVILRTQEREMF